MSSLPIQYKVDINPSYEWAEEAQAMNISHRELEVLALITEGYKNKEVAQIIKIKHQSVKNHVNNLHKKLGVKNNTQAYIIALHLNMIKMRSTLPGYKDAPVVEYSVDEFIEHGRKHLCDLERITNH